MYSTSLPLSTTGCKDLNSLLNLIKRIRAVGIYEQLESYTKPSWDDFQKRFLTSISIQKLYSQLFSYFQGLQNMKTRDLLITYSFVYYDMADDEEDKHVKDSAIKLVQVIHVEELNDKYRSKLYQALHKFERDYIPWKMDDRSKILEKLAHMYWEYEVNFRLYETRLTPEEKSYFLNEKKIKQEECLTIMKRIDNLNYFYQYQPVYVDSETSQLLMDTLRKAFWDRVKNSVNENPPDYKPLNSIFIEIREHLQVMTQNRPEILRDYDEIMDLEFIQARQETNTLTMEFWVQRINYLMNVLIQLDSLEKESYHKKYLQEALTNDNSILHEQCIHILAYIMTRLLEIRKMYDRVFQSE